MSKDHDFVRFKFEIFNISEELISVVNSARCGMER